jgi:RNase P subunit RPR2
MPKKFKIKKNQKKEVAKQNIDFFLNLIKTDFYIPYTKNYIKEVLKLCSGFNIRLQRIEKQIFCRKCFVKWDITTRKIRLNKILKCKEIICQCGNIKRYKYK